MKIIAYIFVVVSMALAFAGFADAGELSMYDDHMKAQYPCNVDGDEYVCIELELEQARVEALLERFYVAREMIDAYFAES